MFNFCFIVGINALSNVVSNQTKHYDEFSVKEIDNTPQNDSYTQEVFY